LVVILYQLVPKIPTNPTLAIATGTGTLAWTAAAGATSYLWTLYNNGSNTSTYTGTQVSGSNGSVSAPTVSTTVANLEVGSNYYYTVSASNASGVSPVAASPIVKYIPNPYNLTLAVTSSNATLTWSAVGSGPTFTYTLFQTTSLSSGGSLSTVVGPVTTGSSNVTATFTSVNSNYYYYTINETTPGLFGGVSPTYTSPVVQYTLTGGDQYFSFVGLLIQGGGANGTSNITDLAMGQTINQVGTATTFSATQTKFASTSIYFPGTGNLSIPYTSNTAMPGDFTWEKWIYQTARGGFQAIIGTYPDTTNRILFSDNNSSSPGFYWEVANSTVRISDTYPPLGTYNLNTWTHLALCRSGNSFYTYVNGTRVETTTGSVLPESSNILLIGACYANGSRITGYIDGLRYTKGVARYTGPSFTLPTAVYPTFGPPPPAPTSPALAIVSGTATMTWTAAAGATSNAWVLYRSASSNYAGTSNASGSTAGATATATASGLTTGYYYFTVSTSNGPSSISAAAVSTIVSY